MFRILVHFLKDELDRPSRSDFYSMAVIREIRLFRRMFNSEVKVPDTLNELKIPFSEEAERELNPPLSDEESAALAKSSWRAIMGKPLKST